MKKVKKKSAWRWKPKPKKERNLSTAHPGFTAADPFHAHYNAGIASELNDNLAEAITQYSHCLHLRPADTETLLRLAKCIAARARAVNPHRNPLFRIGDDAGNGGGHGASNNDPDDSLKIAIGLLRRHLRFLVTRDALLTLADILHLAGHVDESVATFRRVIDLSRGAPADDPLLKGAQAGLMVATHKQLGQRGGGAPLQALRELQSIDAHEQWRRGGGGEGEPDQHLKTLEFLSRSLASAFPQPEGSGVPVSAESYLRRSKVVRAEDDGGYFYDGHETGFGGR